MHGQKTRVSASMIPRIIHQTWRDECIPDRFSGYFASWQKHNRYWQRILWTDRMLLEFVEEHYRDLLDIYCSYRTPVQRADVGRYMILHKFGGVYADLDSECLAPLISLEDETRVVLCHEPPSHWPYHASDRGHPFILFNGVMASPPGHRFWRQVLDRLPETRHAPEVVDATGPCFLTGIYLSLDDKNTVAVESCQLFTPTDRTGQTAPPYGLPVPQSLARHQWAGTWWKDRRHRRRRRKSFTAVYRQFRHRLALGAVLDPSVAQAQIDPSVLNQPPPQGDRLAILVPVRDAASDIEPFFEALAKIDIPTATTKLVFCEGDSVDGTWQKLNEVAAQAKPRYRDIVLLRKQVMTRFDRDSRDARKIQRSRRSGLAKVRNHLIDHGLCDTDDWALWIDIDVWRFPADVVQRLRAAAARIVVPNCVIAPGGSSFDMNSFVSCWDVDKSLFYRYFRDELFLPPGDFRGRLHLSNLRHSERVELDSVGGTMLLVDASLHRGGLRFPERPFKGLIETEGFGALACDVGLRPVGLPSVEVFHVPY